MKFACVAIVCALNAWTSMEAFAGPVLGNVDVIRLYRENQLPDPAHCDEFVVLTLDYDANVATLENQKPSGCGVITNPNKRVFDLKFDQEGTLQDCGSQHWLGKGRNQSIVHNMQIINHGTRKCRDLKPSQYRVREFEDEVFRELFSLPGS